MEIGATFFNSVGREQAKMVHGNLLWLGVRVAEQHPQITMAADRGLQQS
jgi:hypothetical protein